MESLNLTVFTLINRAVGYSTTLDVFFVFLTTYLTFIVVVGGIVYMILGAPLYAIDTNDWKKRVYRGYECIVSVLVTWGTVHLLKIVFAFPRPFITMTDIITLSPFQTGYSFPSGHGALTAALAMSVYFYHKRLGTYLFAFAFMVGLSRVYIGVHYPIDVLVGALVGIGISGGIHILFQWTRFK